ncbi:Exportin 7 [Dissophora ornata]|nr:Exportin 7 [Dissophora ornata]
MATSLDLQTIEQYCETLYNTPDPSSRIHVENLLNYHCPTFSSGLSNSTGWASDLPNTHTPDINSPIESALFCRNVLENSKSPYALMFATSRLKSLVEDHFITFTAAEQHGLRSFVLQYVYRNPGLPPFILAAQAQLFSIITNLGWVDNQEFRPLLDHIQVFFRHGVGHRVLGVQILASVTTQMNLPGLRNVVCTTTISQRDSASCMYAQYHRTKAAQLLHRLPIYLHNIDSDSEKLKEAILLLMKACLAFDFIGTSHEEASDDVGSIQVPTSWKVVFEQPGYLDVLWECWKTFSSPTSILVMECLSQAASIRRSVFSTNDARHAYIYHIMREMTLTITTAAGQNKLQDVGNFHEFCRMLSRFKNTFQLAEVCDYQDSKRWLSAIGEFTTRGFHSWKWSPNSVSYLLTFWSKTVSSLSSVKQDTELLIEAITVNLSRSYLKSCLDCVHAVMDGEADDPLESEETLLLSLEMFASIARTKYIESGRIIVNEFQDLSIKYRELVQRASALSRTTSPPVGSTDVKESLMVIEMQLTWMVYIMAACIGGRVMYQSTSEQDQMDGEFACEALGFIHQLQMWTAQRPLHLASADAYLYIQSSIIYFYSQFRSSYIIEDSSKAVKVYTQLAARWGLNTPNQVLDVIMESSLNNLRSSGDPEWRRQEDQLVIRTLKLFTDLSSGYSSVKYIRKLDTTKALLKNHNSSKFRFLDPMRKKPDTDVGRCRTIYYTMLSRILFSEDNVDASFWRFVRPWEGTLDQIKLAFDGSGDLSEEDIRLILLGLFKDLRGFVTSISNRRQYNLFYEWFYPAYTPIVVRAIEIWPQNDLAIAILRFWLEFATNKSSRITFDSSSPNGILLFRVTSDVLYTYGQNLLSRPISSESTRWAEKYKGIMLYFNIMSVSLSGKYVNFGVFKLYGDKALDRILEIFFQLMLAIPVDDMVSFPKLALSYFSVIDVFALDHMMGLPMMPPPVLGYIFRALSDIIPLPSTNAGCTTMACSAIDKICTFVLNWLIKNKIRKDENVDADTDEMLDTTFDVDDLRASATTTGSHRGSVDLTSSKRHLKDHQGTHWLVEYVLTNKDVLGYLFAALFQVIAFENRSNQWSLSRPMLGLILLNRDFFTEYTTRFVQVQLPDRREQLQKAIDGLLEGIENNLTTANRDRFTTNATAFRRECSQMTLIAFSPEDAERMM